MEGTWTSSSRKVVFAHRRLSIQDLSTNGMQPMNCGSDGSVIVFNGEIYNAEELRGELRLGQISSALWF